jgi:hypothetical protein
MSMMTLVSGATAAQLDSRRAGWLVMGARMKVGATFPQAEAELGAIDRALREEFPNDQSGRALRLQRASPVAGNGPIAVVFVVALAGITSTVLVIACANVAGFCSRAHQDGVERWRFGWRSARDARGSSDNC